MAQGGFSKLPDGTVVVALTLPAPVAAARGVARRDVARDGARGGARDVAFGGGCGTVRVLVHAVNRARALTRLRNLGLRSVYLRGNTHPPTPDEVTAVLHHPDGLIWRSAPLRPDELWHPIRALFRASGAQLRGFGGAPVPSGFASGAGVGGAGAGPEGGPRPGLSEALAARFVPEPLTVPEAWTTSGA